MIPKLLRIGFRGLSIAPPLIPATKDLIRSISLDEFRNGAGGGCNAG